MIQKSIAVLAMAAALAVAQDGAATSSRYLDTSQTVTLIPEKSPTASMNWTMEGVFSLR